MGVWVAVSRATDHVEGGEDVAVVVAGLEVFGDVGKGGEVVRVLCCTRDVPDLVLSDDVLRERGRDGQTDILKSLLCSSLEEDRLWG
jgi:hypothetical protein